MGFRIPYQPPAVLSLIIQVHNGRRRVYIMTPLAQFAPRGKAGAPGGAPIGAFALGQEKPSHPAPLVSQSRFSIYSVTSGKLLQSKGDAMVPPEFLRTIEDSGLSTWLRES